MRGLSVLLGACGLLGATPAHAEAPAPAGVERQLRTLLARCLAEAERCKDFDGGRETARRANELIEKLGQQGGTEVLPLLRQLDARGSFEAGRAREAIQTRRMTQALASRPCAPPSDEEVAAEQARLGDFAVLRVDGDKLVALRPEPEELQDLAYFLVAVRDAGPPVGETQEPGGDWHQPAKANDSLDAAHAELKSARLRGDLQGMDSAARRYLVLLGYPGPLKASEENRFGWHRSRFSAVMREWAEVQEDLGRFGEAATLYRRVSPGDGACGTGWEFSRDEQILGVIRTTEQQAGCHGVVAERLLDADGRFGVSPYGPKRLRDAGFDVARLYRGALVTRHRDIPPEELQRVLSSAPEPLRTEALRRFQERGPEAWEKRVLALEGFADVVQRDAVEPLLALALGSVGETQHRAVAALGFLVTRPSEDPCATNHGREGESGGRRFIHKLGEQCATTLKPRERDALAMGLMPLLESKDGQTREATAEALGRLGSPLAVPWLRGLSQDSYTDGFYLFDDETQETPRYPVQEAAAVALERLR